MGYAFLVAGPDRALLLECGVVDVRASATAAERLLAIAEALEELDDVQKVHANFDVPDEVLQHA